MDAQRSRLLANLSLLASLMLHLHYDEKEMQDGDRKRLVLFLVVEDLSKSGTSDVLAECLCVFGAFGHDCLLTWKDLLKGQLVSGTR